MARWVALLVGFAVALVANVLLFWMSPWGAARIAGVAERLVSAELRGQVRVGAVRLTGWGDVRVERGILVDPLGDVAGSVDSIAVDALVGPLLRGKLVIRELWIEGARVRIDPLDPQAGLPAVFEPAVPPPPLPAAPEGEPNRPPPAPIPIELRSLHLEDAGFLLATPAGEPDVAVRGIWGWIRGSWRGTDARAWVEIRGQVLAPVRAPLHVQVESSLSEWQAELASLAVRLGGTRFDAAGAGDLDRLEGDVRFSGVVDPAEARGVGIPLRAPTPLRGDAHLADQARMSVRLGSRTAGRLQLELEGKSFRALTGAARLEALDPGGWVEGAPPGRLTGRLRFGAALDPVPRVDFSADLGPGEPLGPATIRGWLGEDALVLDEARLSLDGAELVARGRFTEGNIDGQGTLAISDLARLSRWVEPMAGELPELAGEGRIEVEATGTPSDPHLEARGRFPMLRIEGAVLREVLLTATYGPAGALRYQLEAAEVAPEPTAALRPEVRSEGRATIADGRVEGELALAASGVGRVGARFDLPLDPDRAPRAAPLAARVVADPLALEPLGRWLGVPLPRGVVRTSLDVAGTVGAPQARWIAFVEDLHPQGEEAIEPLSAHLFARLDGRGVDLRARAFQGDERRVLDLQASLPFDAASALRDPEGGLAKALDAEEAEARLDLRGIDLAAWSRFVGWEGAAGVASLDLHLAGPLRQPRGAARLDVAGALGPFRRVDAALRIRSEADVVLEGEIALEEQAPLLLVARAGVPLDRLLEAPEGAEITLAWELEPVDLGALPLARGVGGILRTEGRFAGTLGALRGRAEVDVRELYVDDVLLGSTSARVALDEGVAARLWGIDPEGGFLEAALNLAEPRPLLRWARGEGAALLAAPAIATLEAVGLSIRPLQLLPPLNRARGGLTASFRGEGTLEDFAPAGAAELRGGEIQLVGGASYDRVELRATLEPDRLELALLEAHGDRGIAVLQGEAVRERRREGERARFDLRLRARDFPVGGEAGVVARVSSRGRIAGTLGREGLASTVTLEGAEIVLPELVGRELQTTSPPEDVVIFGMPPPPARTGGALPALVHLEVERPVVVRGPDVFLSARVEADVERTEAGDTWITGAVTTQEGNVALLGRTFTIEPSVLRWNRSPPDNPLLDLTARFQGVGAIAWIDVGGTLQSPTVRLRSDPPMQEGEIALLIATGGGRTPGLTPEESVTDEQEVGVGVAASLAGSVVTDRLRQAIGPGLPIDVLSVETAEGQTLVHAGTYLGPRLYVGYARNILPEPGENANEARLTYQLTRSVAVQSRFGDAANGGVDLVWVEHFPTAAQVARRRAGETGEGEGMDAPGPREGEREGEPPAVE